MKNKIDVLVLDSNESLTKEVEKYFSSHEVINVVACFNNGEEGLRYLLNNHDTIDIIVMDLVLPNIDGMFLLSELKRRGINKNIIIVTNLKEDAIVDEISEYGIDYYMLKPINYMGLEQRIISININNNKDILFNEDVMLSDLLHKLGIPSHIRGYNYIKEGIKIVCRKGNRNTYITKDVYPEVSKKYETTPTRVERAIRHAIEVSWSRGDLNLMEDIFGNSLDINRDKPTNAEYLNTLAERMRFNQKVVYS